MCLGILQELFRLEIFLNRPYISQTNIFPVKLFFQFCLFHFGSWTLDRFFLTNGFKALKRNQKIAERVHPHNWLSCFHWNYTCRFENRISSIFTPYTIQANIFSCLNARPNKFVKRSNEEMFLNFKKFSFSLKRFEPRK